MRIQKRRLLLSFGLALCLSACQSKENTGSAGGSSAGSVQVSADQPSEMTGEDSAGPGSAAGNSAGLQSWGAPTLEESAPEESVPGESTPGERPPSEKEAVSVYYGAVCYSLYSEEESVIQEIAGIFKAAQLEETEGVGLDADSTYQVYFTTGEKQLAAINVDKNGIFYLPEEQKFYRDRSGGFSYEKLDRIYQDSMKADGFDAGQCLIP